MPKSAVRALAGRPLDLAWDSAGSFLAADRRPGGVRPAAGRADGAAQRSGHLSAHRGRSLDIGASRRCRCTIRSRTPCRARAGSRPSGWRKSSLPRSTTHFGWRGVILLAAASVALAVAAADPFPAPAARAAAGADRRRRRRRPAAGARLGPAACPGLAAPRAVVGAAARRARRRSSAALRGRWP